MEFMTWVILAIVCIIMFAVGRIESKVDHLLKRLAEIDNELAPTTWPPAGNPNDRVLR